MALFLSLARHVSIHALVRVRLLAINQRVLYSCFNPRTRESATRLVYRITETDVVSIHALVRVRLEDAFNVGEGSAVSIHALVRVRLSKK